MNNVTNGNRTSFGRSAQRALVAAFVGGLVLMASPRSAEASAFMIELLIGSSGGGGGAASAGSVDPGVFALGGNSSFGMPHLGLGAPQLTASLQSNVKPVGLSGPGGAVVGVQRIVNRAQLAGATGFSVTSSRDNASLASISTSTVNTPITGSDIANLNLGNGESLTVSETVAQSLVGNVPGGFPVTNGGDQQVIGSSGFPAGSSGLPAGGVGNNVTNSNNIVANGASGSNSTIPAILPEIALGIVSSPGEITGSSGVVVDTLSALSPGVALDPVPEPGSLLLLGSGLATAAQFLRRRKRLS